MSIEISGKTFDEERALYGLRDAVIADCTFDGAADGESALKESSLITAQNCIFSLRYPLWHTKNTEVTDCDFTQRCRAALWYGSSVSIESSRINGVKALRECENIYLEDCEADSSELLWRCRNVQIQGGRFTSEYPFFECRDAEVSELTLQGKYAFQYVENASVSGCTLHTKDAFWHSKNVTVTDSVIDGEYLGWYSENLTLVRCRIIGTQPLCYCKGLVLRECTMENADLAFERSDVYAEINGRLDSVKNPLKGAVSADEIGSIILEEDYCDAAKVKIVARQQG